MKEDIICCKRCEKELKDFHTSCIEIGEDRITYLCKECFYKHMGWDIQ